MKLNPILRKLTLTTFLSAALIYSATAAEPQKNNEKFVAGRLLIKGKPGLKDDKLAAILAKHAAKSERKIDGPNIHVVKVPPGLEKKLLAELQTDPNVDFVELDREITPDAVPNDPAYSKQWYHTKINSPAAWDLASGTGATIAIVDSGVDSTHPDLAGSMLPGWNTVSRNTDTTDVSGHGTWVAGSAAAISNNAAGIAGLASGAKMVPVRISNETTGTATASAVVDAITWSANNGIRIVNNSYNAYVSSAVSSAAAYLKTKGGIMFASAGNNNALCTVPADPNIVVVSATTSTDTKASFSNYGDCIDVSAPGANIYTTAKGGTYAAVQGTSFASPMSAAVAALILNVNPLLNGNDIEAIMKATGVDLGGTDYSQSFGYGRINPVAAIQMAKTYTPSVIDTTAPTAKILAPVAGAVVKGQVVVDVSAADNAGVERVDFYVDGLLYASDNTAPYSFSWDTVPLGNATPTLSATVTDTSNNKGSTAGVKVTVANIVDTTAPLVRFTSPADGATVSGTVSIRASATDNVGVSSMVMLIDGKQVATATGSAISFNWNTRKVARGPHSIVVRANDASGNQGQLSMTVNR